MKEVEVADKIKNLVIAAEAASLHEENPIEKSESMRKIETKDAVNTEEDTKNSGNANVHQISTEDPDSKWMPR